MTRALFACLATLVLAAGVNGTATQQTRDGQVAAPGAGAISGVVVLADVSGAPVRRATIELTGTSLTVEALVALTDEMGRFAFAGLPSGRYNLRAAKAGFLPSMFGATRPLGDGTPIVISGGQQVNGLQLTLSRGAVMTGSVFDERSRPVPNLEIRALRYAFSPETGETLPEAVRIGTAEGVTDDQGRFRLFGLAPGDYLVSAAPPKREVDGVVREITEADIQWAHQLLRAPAGSAPTLIDRRSKPAPTLKPIGNAPVFHPSADSIANASKVTLRVAEESSAIDLIMRVVRTATILGNVSGPGVTMRGGGRVTLFGESSAFEATARWQQSDGSFVFAGVPPGRYTLVAAGEGQPARGRAEVLVDGQEVRTYISLQPGATLTGRVVFEGAPPAEAALARLALLSIGRSEAKSRPAAFREDGTFSFAAIPSGTYQLAGSVPPGLQPGWRVKSAMRGDVDLLDAPLTAVASENIADVTVTLTRSRSEISGSLLQADGKPALRYTVVVFSADPQLRGLHARRTQVVRPGTDGRFVARDLPAGEYLISAVTEIEQGQWHNKAFLAELEPYGVKVTLADGERKVQDIRLGGGG